MLANRLNYVSEREMRSILDLITVIGKMLNSMRSRLLS